MAESTSTEQTTQKLARDLVSWVLHTRRPDMRAAFGVAGAAGIWQRDLYLTEDGGVIPILIFLACVVALVLGLWWVVGTLVLMASPVRRFKALRGQAEQLAAEFADIAEGELDRQRFVKAMAAMHQLANTLAALDVDLDVTDTDSDRSELVADVARENRDELLRIAALMAEGDLDAARRGQIGRS